MPIILHTGAPQGTATFRVRLSAITGEPVSDYRVIWPGYPVVPFEARGNGIYELTMKVPPVGRGLGGAERKACEVR